MKITGYADTYTKNKLQTHMEKYNRHTRLMFKLLHRKISAVITLFYFPRVFVLIKPDVIDKMGEILKMIIDHDFQITNMKMMKLTPDDVTEHYPMKDTDDKT